MRASNIMDVPSQNNGVFTVLITFSMVIYAFGVNVTTTSETEVIIPTVNPQIYSFHINSEVTYRFATTQVTSRLANNGESAKEATFSVTLPKSAFIMNFSMILDGEVILGEVKEKLSAKKQYDKAKKKGQSAGHVAAKARDSNIFKVSINVAAKSKVDFNLTYQELLKRKLSVYEHLININPGQVVRDMRIVVNIRESRNITVLRVPPVREDVAQIIDPDKVNPLAEIRRVSTTSAVISYSPTMEQQLAMSPQGIRGQFIVQYDVSRGLDAGEMQVIDGYFVHYIAPSGLEAVNKNILFVLDVSSSMSGTKIKQLKEAMATILDDLRPSDVFNIIKFEGFVNFWTDGAVLATPQNVKRAKNFIKQLRPSGGTNINDALMRATEFLNQVEENPVDRTTRTSLAIFLTDGQPTAGIVNNERILENVRNSNRDDRLTLFALGFGHGVNFPFLQKLSLQNEGIARKIYEDSDASFQLEGFYNEVSTPVMADIKVRYIGDVVEEGSLTNSNFSAFFQGSELVVAGKLNNRVNNLQVKVSGGSARGYMSLDMNVRVPKVEKAASNNAASKFTERLWAYLTIRKLLDDILESVDPEEKEAAKAKALELSVKYNFVTPLTSMVVTKPGAEDELGMADSDEKGGDVHRSKIHQPGRYKPGGRRPNSFVDNDPHFLIGIDNIEERVCFDVSGKPGDFYQLVHDKITGIVVNGLIVANKLPPVSGKYKTYLGEIAILRNKMKIIVSPTRIKVLDKTMAWGASNTLVIMGVKVTVEAKKSVSIEMERGIVFRILRHKVKANHPTKVDFLGFYIEDGIGLSDYVHGLIGQFQHQRGNVEVNKGSFNKSPGGNITLAKITLQGPHVSHRTFTAKLGKRRDMKDNVHVPCWRVKNNGRGLIKGHHTEYLVPHLLYTKSALSYYSIANQLPMSKTKERRKL